MPGHTPEEEPLLVEKILSVPMLKEIGSIAAPAYMFGAPPSDSEPPKLKGLTLDTSITDAEQ